MTRVRVVGAGLSGLAAAWSLTRRGIPVEILETSRRPGGLIGTSHLAEGLCERGANAFVWSDAVARLFDELRLEPVFARDSSRRRFIYRNGRPRRWPLGPAETLATAARYGAARLTRSTAPRPDESLAAWGRRVLGQAATSALLSPAFHGIYAAPAEDLSARAVGIGSRRGKIRMATPRDGMGAVVTALENALRARGAVFHFGERAAALDPGVPVIVCTNAASASALIAPHHRAFAEAAARIRSVPIVGATAFFEPRPGDVRGFGVLFPRGTARALGVLFNTDIFDGRGSLRSERWIFGDARLVDAPREEIEAAILRDRSLITAARDPILNIDVHGWRAALPIYDAAILQAAKAAESLPRWLGVAGNYLGRIGVSALVERAEAEANRLARAV